MDESNYRSTSTRRGYTYGYYYLPSGGTKPTILFMHGFPSTSFDWSSQILYASRLGYGVIAPDLLGYGRTSAPEDPEAYKIAGMAEDIIDILDKEKADKVIAVGHDWGCFLLSRTLNIHQDRFIAAAFLAVGYVPPTPQFDYENYLALMNKMVGYDVFGYWEYFGSPDTPRQVEENLDSFYSLLFPSDPLIWKTDLAVRGKAREWIEQKKQAPLASFMDGDMKKQHQANLLKSGLRGPFAWYAGRMSGLNNADDAAIPLPSYTIAIPTFYGSALKDYVCLASAAKAMMPKFCPSLTVKEFDASHWVPLEVPDELNAELGKWFGEVAVSGG